MNLMRLSTEQQSIINDIRTNHVQVTAVAGCGKTTTNLFLAQQNKDLNILLLTYNASLRIETNLKIAEYGLRNIQVHTFHSFAFKFYKECYNDYGIFEILEYQLAPLAELSDGLNFDIIILDEMQDMTLLYFRFICKIYHDNKAKSPRFCILGDPHQTIYQYNGSDSQYFENFVRLFEYREWKKYKLKNTFRCTNSVSDFLNTVMLQDERIFTNKDGPLVKYLMCDTYEDDIFREVTFCLSIGYKVDDIFILAPSIKTASSPVRRLSEKFSFHNYPVFVSYSDEDKPNERVLRNKLVFLSFHQSKGLERKVVIVLGFDNSYFLYYKKGYDPLVCPNELYVAVTRSSERLIVVHDVKHDFLPFLNIEAISKKTNFVKRDLKKKRVYSKEAGDQLAKSTAQQCFALRDGDMNGGQSDNASCTAKKMQPIDREFQETLATVHLPTTGQEPLLQTIFNISVSNLLKKLTFEDIHRILLTLNIKKISCGRKRTRIELPNIILIDKSHFQTFTLDCTNSVNNHHNSKAPMNEVIEECIYENVSDINSLVIFSLFEYLVTEKSYLTRNSNFDLKHFVSDSRNPKGVSSNAPCALDSRNPKGVSSNAPCALDSRNPKGVSSNAPCALDIQLECFDDGGGKKQRGGQTNDFSKFKSNSYPIMDKKNLDLTTQLCVERLCIKNNYIFKLYQLKSFDWLDPETIDECLYRLLSFGISKDAEFEKEIEIFDSKNHILLCGRLDCMDTSKRIVWEFKCVSKIDYLHFLQLALYYYIMNKDDISLSNSDFSYYLYNVPDDEWYEMKVEDKEGLLCIIRKILLECRHMYENPTVNGKSHFDFSKMTLHSQKSI
jgi:hypothetical protein